MLRQSGSTICIIAVAFLGISVAKPPPSPSKWTSFDKPTFSRPMGPPFAKSEFTPISVPYVPKTSPFFPKFVDPRTMIAQKTDMLSKLFGGTSKVDDFGRVAGGFSQQASGFPYPSPVLYAPYSNENIEAVERFMNDKAIAGENSYKRDISERDTAAFGEPKASFFPINEASKFTAGLAPAGSSRFLNTDSSPEHQESIMKTENVSSDEKPTISESKFNSPPREMSPGFFKPLVPFNPYIAVTEVPIPKSTIVPPDFWLPSSIIPGPTEYTEKVSTFLQKLFETIALNKTVPTVDEGGSIVSARSLDEDLSNEKHFTSRSVDEIKTIAAAKDAMIDSILSDLGYIKSDMVSTLNKLILYEKAASASRAKKPMKPVSPFAAFFAPPTPDPMLPFTQRMDILSQVFDMLTDLQKNITMAVHDAMKSSTDPSTPQDSGVTPNDATPAYSNGLDHLFPTWNVEDIHSFNRTLFDAIKARIQGVDNIAVTDPKKPIAAENMMFGETAMKYPTSVWVAYPRAGTGPVKRNVEDNQSELPDSNVNDSDEDRDQFKRLIHMRMHQGYQSMPAGAIESVQAGGGAVQGHEGGGIKLLDAQKYDGNWRKWAKYFENGSQGHRNHRHHG